METIPRRSPTARDPHLILKRSSARARQRARRLNILRYERVQSTNKLAYRLAEKSSENWTVVVSEVQTQGRGRHGRHWRSPKGGLWFSIIMIKPAFQADQVPILQFFAANASLRGIETLSGL